MQSFTNQAFLKKRAQYAKWGSYIGFGALALGLIMTGRSLILSYAFLLVGLLGASVGSYMASRYVREPRTDQTLENKLDGLDKRYTLYNYYLPSNHVIASHYGLTVLIAKNQEGKVTYRAGKWQHKTGFRRVFQLFGEPGVGKPEQDVSEEVKWVKEWIDQVFPEDDIPVNGVVVFTNPKVELQAGDAQVPVVTVDELPRYMKQGLKGQPTLTTAVQNELRKNLDEVAGAS